MSDEKKPAKSSQLNALTGPQLPQISFDLGKQDFFIRSNGIEFEHYRAIPSPIGKKEKGDYRQPGELDVQSSNGNLYRLMGVFTAVMMGNSKKRVEIDSGFLNNSVGRVTLPRFYNKDGAYCNGDRIYLYPGDRLYVRNKNIDMKVVESQEVHYEPERDNLLQYPANVVQFLVDSRGIDYVPGVDFELTKEGNIRWIQGARNPGIDPETGKGRIYSVSYLYNAHWYIMEILNEVRIGNVTVKGCRTEERLPYHAVVVRESVYHNRIRGQQTKPSPKLVKEDKSREHEQPELDVNPDDPYVPVQMSDLGGDEETGE